MGIVPVQLKSKKLNRKILTILTVALILPMIAITYFSAVYQAKDLRDQMSRFGDELANSIYGGIKYPMSVGDSAAIRSQLLDMQMKDTEVYICDSKQDIIYSNRKEMLGTKVNSTVYGQKSRQDPTGSTPAGGVEKTTAEETINGSRYLTTLWLLHNQEECHRCHGPGEKVLGSLVVKMATDRTYTEIRQHTLNNVVISVIGVCVIIGLSYALLNRLIIGPVTRLASNMRELPHQLAANAALIESSNRDDEIGEMEKSFNQMALELRDKQRIIERTNLELAEANDELESFAYSVSHDLRAPLRNIDGFAKILLDEYGLKFDDTGRHYLSRVRNGALRMSRLIDDMLTFSRAGRQEIQRREVDANLLVREVLQDFADDIKTRQIKVTIEELPRIVCDQGMIRNVFANLLSNAIKYTGKVSQATITIGFDKQKNSIFIKDNGIGFDMKYHDKIFQVFQRLQLPDDYEGTGIGLAIAKRIIERHKGSIWADSAPGQGSTFFMSLPAGQAATNQLRR